MMARLESEERLRNAAGIRLNSSWFSSIHVGQVLVELGVFFKRDICVLFIQNIAGSTDGFNLG